MLNASKNLTRLSIEHGKNIFSFRIYIETKRQIPKAKRKMEIDRKFYLLFPLLFSDFKLVSRNESVQVQKKYSKLITSITPHYQI